MASIYIYKTSTIPDPETLRYELTTMETVNITMDQPVSPMALPQEDANENVLVKMEGNTESVNISWKVINSSSSPFKKEDSVLTSGNISRDTDVGGTPISWDSSPNFTESIKTIQYLLNSFQGKNISDRYFIKFPDSGDIMEGFITRMDFSASGDSPVIWSGNLTFVVGNVISMYDGDSSSSPRSVSASQVGSTGSTSDATKTKIRLRWQAPSDSGSTVTNYKIYRRGENTSFLLFNTLSDSNLDGAVSGNTSYKEFAVTGLTSAKTYYFKISAENDGGEGLKSDVVVATFP
jgi:hypothetical protein